jgi:hypothetical protein
MSVERFLPASKDSRGLNGYDVPLITPKPRSRLEVRLVPHFADPKRGHLGLWLHEWPPFGNCRSSTMCPQQTHPELIECQGDRLKGCPACQAGVPLKWNGVVYALTRDQHRAVCLKVTGQNFSVLEEMFRAGCLDYGQGSRAEIIVDDNWKWSWKLLERDPLSELDYRMAVDLELRTRKWTPRPDLLQQMALAHTGWIKAGKPMPEFGQHGELLELLPGCILVRIPWGLKGPRDPDWQNTTWAMMQDEGYRSGLDAGNIGLVCGQDIQAVESGALPDTVIVGLDADTDTFAARVVGLNPWLNNTFAVEGGRGLKWFFELAGANVAKGLQSTKIFDRHGNQAGREVGDWLSTGKQGVVLGLHPSGKMYRHNGKRLLRVERFSLPKTCYMGWHLDAMEAESGAGRGMKHRCSNGPILDMARLENVHRSGKGTEAACPACREDGKDSAGDNLLIFADGRYRCAATIGCSAQETGRHNSRIYRLCGNHRPDYDL